MSWDKTKDELRDQVVRQTNKRKSTAKWCKGKVGREHDPELVINHSYVGRARPCGWRDIYLWRNGTRQFWRWNYSCIHSYRCKNCGKYTEDWLKNNEECPDFKPMPEQ